MVGTNVKQETMTLMEKRTSIEAELEVIISRLCLPNAPGLSGNLVDKDGFPRADIDIPAVRADRQRLSVLRNDHKEATSKIEQNLHILHSGAIRGDSTLPQKRTAYGEESRPQRSSFVAQSSESAITNGAGVAVYMDEDTQPKVPFAVFDEISAGSPAELDGVMLGDLLVKFGRVQGGDNLLSRLALEGQQNQGSAIQVVVLRRGVPVHLTLTPRQWPGRGLLGCHIRPL
jgi:26S proteasome non-ATPase regulatory subunit 9